MSAKHKTATVAAPAPEAKKPAPDDQGFQEQTTEFETSAPMAMRQKLADPGRMSQTDIRTAQRAYGNQFVQRLARGTTVHGVRNTRLERGGKSPVQLSGDGGGAVNAQVENRIESQRGSGAPLPEHTQDQMSDSFGADFSGVRVHTGGESNDLNRSLNARAFTTGQDVYFADNEYNPDSSGGQELIAHELTHVVQQGGAPAKSPAQTKPVQRGMADMEDESLLATKPVQRGMADMEDESLLATKPVQRGMADMEDESLLATKRVPGAPVQRAMTVNAPGDEYEQEADSTARQVMSKSMQRSATDEEDESLLATKRLANAPVQRGMAEDEQEQLLTKRVQRSLFVQRADDNEEEAKQKKEAEQQSAQVRDKEGGKLEKEADKKEGDKGPDKKEEGEAGKDDKKSAVAGMASALAPAGGPAAPTGPAAGGPSADELISQQEGAEERSFQKSDEVAGGLSWAANKPQNWDSETILSEVFSSVIGGEAQGQAPEQTAQRTIQKRGLPTSAAVQRADAPPAAAPAPAAAPPKPVAGSKGVGGGWATETPEGDKYAVPAHENWFANLVVGDTAGKATQMANKWAGFSQETNAFGYAARTLEGILGILDLVNSILGYISLALTIVAAILYALGLILGAIPFTAAAGPPLIAAATALMKVAEVLGKVSQVILIIMIAFRVLIIAMRALDYLYSWATGASAEDLKKKAGMMSDQAIGIVSDGISLATTFIPFPAAKKLGKSAGKGLAVAGAQSALGYAGSHVSGGFNKAQDAAKEDINKGGDNTKDQVKTKSKDNVQRADDAGAGLMGEGKAAPEVSLSQPPSDAPERVDSLATDIGDAEAEKLYLQDRLATLDFIIGKKANYEQNAGAAQAQNKEQKGALQVGNAALQDQASKAQQFNDKAKEVGPKASEAQGNSGSVQGTMGSMQSQISSGTERAAEEKPEIKKQDPNAANNSAGASKDASKDSGALSASGASSAAKSKQESEGLQGRNQQAQAKIEQFDNTIGEKRSMNQAELGNALAERQAILDRLTVIDAAEADLKNQHQSALDEANAWANQHQSERQSQAEPALREQLGDEQFDVVMSGAGAPA